MQHFCYQDTLFGLNGSSLAWRLFVPMFLASNQSGLYFVLFLVAVITPLTVATSTMSSFAKTTSMSLSSSSKTGNNGLKAPVMYEISARPFLYEQGLSSVAEISDKFLDSLAENGIDMIWMMGVWELGAIGLEIDQGHNYDDVLPGWTKDDVIGSPYAIVKYVVNPSVGTMDDLANFRSRAAARGMKLMTDFVPNHTAIDGDWAGNPDLAHYFIRQPEGEDPNPERYMDNGFAFGRDPYSGAWIDTAQLNYWDPDARAAFKEALLTVASVSDAIRCDMAMLDLTDIFGSTWGHELDGWGYSRPDREFWDEAISAVKAAHPDVIFLAEAYWDTEPQLHANGFDYCYDKTLYDRLYSGDLEGIRSHIAGAGQGYLSKLAHFVENHDEPRAMAEFGSAARANAAAAISFTIPGMHFHHHGQWVGKAAKLDVHLRRSSDEPINDEVVDFYARLLPVTGHPVFTAGTWNWIDVKDDDSAWRLMAWRWDLDNEKRLVVVNYSDATGAGRAVLPNISSGTITELLTGEEYERDPAEIQDAGLLVVVDAWSAQIFKYE